MCSKVQKEEDQARADLAELQQKGSVKAYMNEFNEIILNLLNLSEEDKAFEFKKAPKSEIKVQMELRGLTDIT